MYDEWAYDDESNQSVTAATFPPLTSDEVEVRFALAQDHRDAYEHAFLAPAQTFVSAPQLAALDLLRSHANEIAAAIPAAARAYTKDWPWDVEARAEKRRKAARAMEEARAEAFGDPVPPPRAAKAVFEDFDFHGVEVGAPSATGTTTIRLLGECAWDSEHGVLIEIVDGQMTRLAGP